MLKVHKYLKSNTDSYNYQSNRIVQLQLKLSRSYLTVIGIYAPIEGNEDENDCFYKLLHKILDKINKSDMIAIMGDSELVTLKFITTLDQMGRIPEIEMGKD
jgi:hypothetical protein